MPDQDGFNLTDRDLAAVFTDPQWAAKFPPVLTLPQAAALSQIPLETLYQWRARGLLGGCSRRVGKRVLVFRDRFLKQIFNHGIDT